MGTSKKDADFVGAFFLCAKFIFIHLIMCGSYDIASNAKASYDAFISSTGSTKIPYAR